MAKAFRLSCPVKSYVESKNRTVRPRYPQWLKDKLQNCFLSARRAGKTSAIYWDKIYWATPSWLNQKMIDEMRDIYLTANIDEHVDHIVPLKSNLVCGLHVPWNLQILKAKHNLYKSNDIWPGHPYENQELLPVEFEPHQMGLL